MINPVFCIRDAKGDFWQPKVYLNQPSAVREFAMIANEPGNVVSFAPRDFELYEVGSFDTKTGKLIPYDVLKFCANAADLVGAINEK